MSSFFIAILLVIVFLFALFTGWRVAHLTVAEECQRLGGFFVGDRVYRCINVEKIEGAVNYRRDRAWKV